MRVSTYTMGPKSIDFNFLRVRKEPEVKQRPTSWALYSMGNTNVVGEQAAYPCASISWTGTNHCWFYLWDFGRSQNWRRKKQAAIIGKNWKLGCRMLLWRATHGDPGLWGLCLLSPERYAASHVLASLLCTFRSDIIQYNVITSLHTTCIK